MNYSANEACLMFWPFRSNQMLARYLMLLGALALLLYPQWAAGAQYNTQFKTLDEIMAMIEERPVKRKALLVGIADYDSGVSSLPGVINDLDLMNQTLSSLGFETHVHCNVANNIEFQNKVLKPFYETIEPNDLVVVYYSGHGFNYVGRDYFAFADFPADVNMENVAKYSFPVVRLDDILNDKKPSAVVVVSDACRKILAVTEKGNTSLPNLNQALSSTAVSSLVPAQCPLSRSITSEQKPSKSSEKIRGGTHHSNYLSLFATVPGEGALMMGSESGPYTRNLANLLPRYSHLYDVYKQLRFDVEYELGERFKDIELPSFNDQVNAYVYYNFSDELLLQLKKRLAELLSGSGMALRDLNFFASAYATTPYAAYARGWLNSNQTKENSKFDPISVELAWNYSEETKQAVSIEGITSNLPLVASRISKMLSAETMEKYAAPAMHFQEINSGRSIASVDCLECLQEELVSKVVHLSQQKSIKTDQSIKVYDAPVSGNKLSKPYRIAAYTNVEIAKTVTFDEDPSKAWVALSSRALGEKYARVNVIPEKRPLIMAKSIAEINVPRIEMDNLGGVLDEDYLNQEIDGLRKDGYTIAWVSMHTATPSNDQHKMRDVFEYRGRVFAARAVLSDRGIDTRTFTYVENEIEDVDFNTTIIKLFGYKSGS